MYNGKEVDIKNKNGSVTVSSSYIGAKDPKLREYAFEQIFLTKDEMNIYKYAYEKCCFEDRIKYERREVITEMGSTLLKTGYAAVGALLGGVMGIVGGPVVAAGSAALLSVSMAKMIGLDDTFSEMLYNLKSAKETESSYKDFLNKYHNFEKGRTN